MSTLVTHGAWPRAYALEARSEFIKLWRQPAFLIPTLAFPCLFYGLFGILMTPGGSAGQVSRYLLATYAAFGAIGPALFGFAVGLAEERSNGLLDLKRVLPTPPLALYLARIAMAVLFAWIIGALLLTLATGFAGVRLSAEAGVRYFLALALGTLPFAALGLLIGTLVRAQAANALVQLIYLPLGFLGGLWFPIYMLPKFIQGIAQFLPSFHFGQLMLWSVGAQPALPWQSVAVLSGYCALLLAAAGFSWTRLRE